MSSRMILIQNFPLPPSSNELYFNLKGVGRVSTPKLKEYKKEVFAWKLSNKLLIDSFDELMNGEWKNYSALKVDTYFVFKRERIFCKDGRPKMNDASNRVKACHDGLAGCLGVDDKFFFAGHFEKISGEKECVIILISPITPLTAIELLSTFADTHEQDTVQ